MPEFHEYDEDGHRKSLDGEIWRAFEGSGAS
jgi:hypothetical protein